MNALARKAIAVSAAALVAVAPFTVSPSPAGASEQACGANLPANPKRYFYAEGNCAIFGRPGLWRTFTWRVLGNRNAVLQVQTYNTRGQPYWVNCGSWHGGRCRVPIGDNLFKPDFRAWNWAGFSHIHVSY
ncbi:hypothetical protein [Nonomuraea turcica]|uniref:hypothetical protein n=1 Tax=Nonomuraea sp. G32 TaxID=3067274 RepID=UPI00273BB853|nr:hypothetical protein [Nonomuraea sp. G32]MDP4505083.1 hypothetical protein [Nonomuraea sp. G32]